MNTSGRRVSELLEMLPAQLGSDFAFLDTRSFRAFLDDGQRRRDGLVQIVHDEMDPDQYDVEGMQRWLTQAQEFEQRLRGMRNLVMAAGESPEGADLLERLRIWAEGEGLSQEGIAHRLIEITRETEGLPANVLKERTNELIGTETISDYLSTPSIQTPVNQAREPRPSADQIRNSVEETLPETGTGEKLGLLGASEVIRASGATARERRQGLDLYESTEAMFVELRAPSRLGTSLVSLSLNAVGVDEGSPHYGFAAGAALMGYAARMAQPNTAATEDLATVESQLPRASNGALDYRRMADEADRLLRLGEFTASLIDDLPHLLDIAGLTEGDWTTFSATATMQLHKNAIRNGLPREYLPPPEGVDQLLRLGYAVRLVDEVAGEPPLYAADLE